MKKLSLILTAALLISISSVRLAAEGRGKGVPASASTEAKQRAKEMGKSAKEKQEETDLEAKKNMPVGAQNMKKPADTKAKDPNKALGLGHQKHLRVIEEQLNHERAKHLERQARLERIRNLAKEKDNQKLADKAEELMQKENERHENFTQMLEHRKQRIMQVSQADQNEIDKKHIREYRRGREREKLREMEEEKIRRQETAFDANDPNKK